MSEGLEADGLTPEQQEFISALRRALSIAVQSYAEALSVGDWSRAESFAQFGYGLLKVAEGDRAGA